MAHHGVYVLASASLNHRHAHRRLARRLSRRALSFSRTRSIARPDRHSVCDADSGCGRGLQRAHRRARLDQHRARVAEPADDQNRQHAGGDHPRSRFYNTTIVIRTVGDYWSHLDPRLTQVARTLGANPIRIFTTITLPLLAPSILAASLLVFIFDFTSFGVILIFRRRGIRHARS